MVSIVFFFLNKGVPGSRVEAILQNRGLTVIGSDLEYYQKEYTKLAEELGENLPPFYVSIRPSFKKPELPDYKYPRINKLCTQLSDLKYPHRSITDLAESMMELENYCNETSNPKSKSYFSSLYAEKDLHNWLAILENWQKETNDELVLNMAEHLKYHVIELENRKVNFYYPCFKWNGLGNQYHFWITGFVTGKFGVSVVDGQNVSHKIWKALQWTLMLVFISLVASIAFSIGLSLIMIKFRRTSMDNIIMALLNGIFAIPVFWMATLFIVFFTTKEYGAWTDWFPSPIPNIIDKDYDVLAIIFARMEYLILPVVCIVLKDIPVFTRLIYTGLESEMNKPYAIALKGKGLKENTLVVRHLLPNSLIPIITLIGNYLPLSFAGSLIIEVIFNIPGMGRLLFQSIFNGDYGVCFGILMMITLVTIIVLAWSDVLYKWVNPKMKVE